MQRGVRQLVLLGAGMDARAYRLRLPELKVFEVRISEQHTDMAIYSGFTH
jgi:O-methyltransferase involved in polyketide biosynthesis